MRLYNKKIKKIKKGLKVHEDTRAQKNTHMEIAIHSKIINLNNIS